MVMTTTPADAVVDAIITRLLADTGAGGVAHADNAGDRIYRDVAPTDATTYPMVTVAWMADDPLLTVNGEYVWSDVLVLTKVTDRHTDDYTKTLRIAARIFERLQGYERVTVNGVYITKLRIEDRPPQPSDYIGGRRYLYSNQVWRTEAEPA